jgi:hypothetical protein
LYIKMYMENYNKPAFIGEIEMPELGSIIKVFSTDDEGSVECVNYRPKNENPNAGRMLYMSESGATNEDGSKYESIPYDSTYEVGFVLTKCKTLGEFKEKQLTALIKQIQQKLGVINK